ncbi:hypothetical protein HYPSUDRAFT_71463 [Hypholoma sublateritium FD-334 SS-4]|uniref:Uncharacterized protein n=1 Tax=Hypholoma sublateritium (strain FD-334 SS-4) TaxID=945553 RepID=A0A0D2KNX2_HYPSF|nr:hypothetical protein HYPSUDRAFT_71463 [Hypholoma sublateritium FD-334 SS-4]
MVAIAIPRNLFSPPQKSMCSSQKRKYYNCHTFTPLEPRRLLPNKSFLPLRKLAYATNAWFPFTNVTISAAPPRLTALNSKWDLRENKGHVHRPSHRYISPSNHWPWIDLEEKDEQDDMPFYLEKGSGLYSFSGILIETSEVEFYSAMYLIAR